MSATRPQDREAHREPALAERLPDRPGFSVKRMRKANPRELAIRFGAGAATSVVAGIVTLLFGPRIGGVLLAFPAILAASLTLIEEQGDSQEAREDARGALAGACGLIAFAVVAVLILGHVAGGVALLLATAGWAAVAFGLYRALWYRR